MTNEPPTDGTPDPEGAPPADDGLVEADLPGMSDGEAPRPEPPAQQPPDPPRAEPDPIERVDEAIRNTENARRAAEESRRAEFERRQDAWSDALRPDPFDSPVTDSVLDDLTFDLPRAAAGIPTPPTPEDTTLPDPPEFPDQTPPPFQDDRVRQAIETEISAESRAAQAESDDARASTDPEEWDALQPDPPLIQDWGPAERHIDLSPRERAVGSPTNVGIFVIAVLGAAGVATAFLLGIGPFGGSDDSDATSLPAATAAATIAATGAPAAATADVVSEAPAIASTPDDLALAGIEAYADETGDLWLQLQLEAPLGVDPDTLAFVYAFAIGAAIETDAGYNGFYFSVLDGSSYGEAFFGSADFPRTSNAFSASFQIDQPDLWITDEGALAVHLPGVTAGSGLDAGLFGPTSTLLGGTTVVEEQGGSGIGGFEEYPLGAITVAGSLPLDGWIEIQPDSEPLRLDVPDTSSPY